jgi:type II secretory pathway pseudopilin PulG
MEFWRRFFQPLQNRLGLSLFEVLLAVGILSGVIGGVMGNFVTNIDHQARLDDMIQGTTLANQKMIEVIAEIEQGIARSSFPGDKEKAGDFGKEHEDYEWSYSIKRVEIPLSDQQTGEDGGQSRAVNNILSTISKQISDSVREVKVTVTWVMDGDEDEEDSVTLTTHMVNLP